MTCQARVVSHKVRRLRLKKDRPDTVHPNQAGAATRVTVSYVFYVSESYCQAQADELRYGQYTHSQ